MSADLCGYTVVDHDGIEGPCDLPATGWRWYQDVEHEDALDAACDLHSNEGGRRIKALEAEVERLHAEARENFFHFLAADTQAHENYQALEEVREALKQPHPISAHGRVKAVLERRMGADWLNGRGDSE